MSYTTASGVPSFISNNTVNVWRTYNSFMNNSKFYALVNKNYQSYYRNKVWYDAQWLDGWVMDFHKQDEGIFSTRLYSTLVRGIARHISGKKLYYSEKDGNDVTKFIAANEDKWNLHSEITGAIEYALGLSTSAIKINTAWDGLWLQALRLDQFFFTTDFKGKLVDFTCLIKSYANTNSTKDTDNYYLVEHRYFKLVKKKTIEEIGEGDKKSMIVKEDVTEIPYVEYTIKKVSSDLTKNADNDFTNTETIRWDSLPKWLRDNIKEEFNIIDISKPQKLPFAKDLGVVIFKNEDRDISFAGQPFGTSLASGILSYLITYDLAYSYFNRDLYFGKAMVLKPKGMSIHGQDTTVFSAFSQSIFEEYQSADPDKQTPQFIQAQLRASEWQQVQDNILKKIATSIGMSPKTIASYLNDGGQKTAEEVRTEQSASLNYIELARANYGKYINELLRIILAYYGQPNDVSVSFTMPSFVDYDTIVDRACKMLQNNLIDKRGALKMVHPEMDEIQIDALMQKIESEIESEQEAQMKAWENNAFGQ